jgi:hypothetical protein
MWCVWSQVDDDGENKNDAFVPFDYALDLDLGLGLGRVLPTPCYQQ